MSNRVFPVDFWPVYVFAESGDVKGVNVDVDDEFVQRFEANMEEFMELQGEIEDKLTEENKDG
jgi:hypothetical protein